MFAHTVKWFQVLQSLGVKVELGVMAMKGYSTFPKAPELKSHCQCHTQQTGGRDFYPSVGVAVDVF